MVAQLTLDFSAIAPSPDQTYAIAYLEKANAIYSGDILSDNNRIKGVFYHQGTPYACVGASFKWVLSEVFLRRLYSPQDWQSKPREQPSGRNYYWGREIQYRGMAWIMGDRLTLRATPQDKAIATAEHKITWSLEKIERSFPYAMGERRDPSWGIAFYRDQVEEARSCLLEGLQEAESLGVPVDRDRIQEAIKKLDKI